MPSSIGGIVGGVLGGSTPKPPNVQTWQPTGTNAFDKTYQDLVNKRVSNNPYTQYAPQAKATFNAQYNDPYAPGYQAAANSAGAAYGAQGAADTAAAGALTGAGNTDLTAALQALGMGFDPRNIQHNQGAQHSADVANANSAARGITNSPYGASVANTASQNFESDWQNQQLTRAIQALSGYTGGVTNANSAFAGADTLGTAGASNIAKAGAVPFAASTDITANQNDAITKLMGVLGNSGAGQWDQSTIDDLMSYLNLGANQSNQQGNFDLENYANKLAAAQASQKGLGGIVSDGVNIASHILPFIM